MGNIQKLLRLLLAGLAVLQLAACSKTVHWEEEVPLNIGETVWVKRTVKYTLQGDAGNPLDIAYRPDRYQRLEFVWRDRQYDYQGDASIHWLAISPQQQPVLVAKASNGYWDLRHGYACTTPSYVQFLPDGSGQSWSWPPAIEPWLYGLPGNLMLERKNPKRMKSRYSAEERDRADSGLDKTYTHIDPSFTNDDCKKGK